MLHFSNKQILRKIQRIQLRKLNKIRFMFNSSQMEKTNMIQILNTKYHSLNLTQIQIRLIRDLQGY